MNNLIDDKGKVEKLYVVPFYIVRSIKIKNYLFIQQTYQVTKLVDLRRDICEL